MAMRRARHARDDPGEAWEPEPRLYGAEDYEVF